MAGLPAKAQASSSRTNRSAGLATSKVSVSPSACRSAKTPGRLKKSTGLAAAVARRAPKPPRPNATRNSAKLAATPAACCQRTKVPEGPAEDSVEGAVEDSVAAVTAAADSGGNSATRGQNSPSPVMTSTSRTAGCSPASKVAGAPVLRRRFSCASRTRRPALETYCRALMSHTAGLGSPWCCNHCSNCSAVAPFSRPTKRKPVWPP